jgi:MFS transporter, NNP family, nitrate/nitrite transporter
VTSTVRATVGGCALGVAAAWPVTNIGAIADAIADDYGVSLATVGLFTTALFVVHASMQIPAGKVVDAVGARRVGFVGLLIIVATSALALAAPDPGLVIASRALTGIGTALGFVAGIDYVRAHGGTPFSQGLYGGVALGGAGVALAVVPLAEDWLDWRAPFVTTIAVAVLAAVPLLLGPADSEVTRPERHADAAHVPGILRDARLYRICVVYMASFGLSIVLGNWVATLLTRAGGASEAAAGAAGSLILLGGVVSRPLGGTLARRHGDKTRLILGASFVASAVGTAVVAIAGPLALSAAGALLLGLAAGIPFAACFAAATRTRPDAPAVAAGMVNMSGNLVIVVCTPLLGLAFSLPGDGRIGFAATAAIWLGTLALLPLVRELDTARGAGAAAAREAAVSP